MTSNGVVLFIIPEVVFLFHYEGKIFFLFNVWFYLMIHGTTNVARVNELLCS